jgi:hypothetical protein
MALFDEQIGVTERLDSSGTETPSDGLQDAGGSRTSQAKKKVRRRCFACGKWFMSDGGRFHSEECRESFDAGNPSYTQRKKRAARRLRDDVELVCLGCHEKFSSRGLRCCSPKCEAVYCKQERELAERRELGIEPVEKPKCAACGDPMPIWIKGRRARADRRFCSDACRQRSRFKSAVATPVSERRLAPGSGEKNADEMRFRESTPAEGRSCLAMPIDLIGGRRRPKGSLDVDLVREIIMTEIGERRPISRDAEPVGSDEPELPMAA